MTSSSCLRSFLPWSLAVTMSGLLPTEASAGDCTPSETALCLQGGRLRVEVEWGDGAGATGRGQVLPHSSNEIGFFWFFDPLEVDHFVRVLDGREVNGYFWVFFGSLTNVEYTLTVTDTVHGSQAVYTNPLGSFTSGQDTEAIPDVPKTAAFRPIEERATRAASRRAAGSCVADATTLCLADRRFGVEVDWKTSTTSGQAMQEPVTNRTGSFWFFNPSNTELLVKIVVGDNGFFWFFAGAITDVEYTIRVTDTCASTTETYVNPLDTLASFGDFEALPLDTTCAVFTDGFESGDTTSWTTP